MGIRDVIGTKVTAADLDGVDLRARKKKALRNLRESMETMNEHKRSYQELIVQGADTDPIQRQVLAAQAELESLSHALAYLEVISDVKDLYTITGYQARLKAHTARERVKMKAGPTEGLPDVDEDIDVAGAFDEVLDEIERKLGRLGEITDMIQTQDLAGSSATDAERLMEEVRAGKIDADEVGPEAVEDLEAPTLDGTGKLLPNLE